MCEILLRLTSKTNVDPIVDRRGAWKTGMVITAQEDGWKWSETEKTWPYKIVKLTDIPVADVIKWLEPEYEDPEAKELSIYRRRRFIVDTTQLTSSVLTSLENITISTTVRLATLDTISTDMTVEEPH